MTLSDKSITDMHRVQGLFLFLAVVLLPAACLARPPAFAPEYYDHIPPEFHEKVGVVVRVPTAAKRAPVEPFKSSMAAYRFLLDDLPLASKLSRAAGIAHYVVEPRESGLHVEDKSGMRGMLYLLHQEPGLRIFYADGKADARLLPTLSGRGVMEVRFHETDEGLVANDVTIWLQLDNRVLRLVTKILWPLVGKLVKRKTSVLSRASQELSERLYSEPGNLYRRLEKSGLASPEELAKLKRFLSGPLAAQPSPSPRSSAD